MMSTRLFFRKPFPFIPFYTFYICALRKKLIFVLYTFSVEITLFAIRYSLQPYNCVSIYCAIVGCNVQSLMALTNSNVHVTINVNVGINLFLDANKKQRSTANDYNAISRIIFDAISFLSLFYFLILHRSLVLYICLSP